jgi:hypothetical protein
MWVLRWISDESTLDIHLLLWRGFYLIDPFVNRAPFFFYWLPSQCFHYYDLVHVLFSFLTSSIVLTSHYPNQHSSTCLLSRSSSGHQSRLAAKWQPHLRTSLYLTPMLDPISRHYIVLFLYLLTCLVHVMHSVLSYFLETGPMLPRLVLNFLGSRDHATSVSWTSVITDTHYRPQGFCFSMILEIQPRTSHIVGKALPLYYMASLDLWVCFVELEFELRPSCLQHRCSTAWATPSVHFALVISEQIICLGWPLNMILLICLPNSYNHRCEAPSTLCWFTF